MTTSRKPATADNLAVGSIVYRGKTSRIAYTVVGFENDPQDPNGQLLVMAQRPGYMETWFTLGELTTRV